MCYCCILVCVLVTLCTFFLCVRGVMVVVVGVMFFCALLIFFFFKQKTEYEVRISDWSSDVCSSDLGLQAEQILDGMEDRTRMRLHGDAVFRLQHGEIQRRHDGRQRGRGGLVAADLEAVAIGAQVVGVMDGPGR